MRHLILACLGALLFASPASAVTNDQGEVLITQADALAGNVTPGDLPGYPITISVPGSYRLTTGLTVTTAAHGIDVTAAEVTINMAGFRIIGSGVGLNGINGRQRSLTVKDGTIRAFAQDGIRTIGQFLTVEDMRITDNGRFGIQEDPASINVGFAAIRNTVVHGNLEGIYCALKCQIESSQIVGNTNVGVYFNQPFGTILDSQIVGNDIGVFGVNFNAGDTAMAGNTTLDYSGILLSLSPNRCGVTAC